MSTPCAIGDVAFIANSGIIDDFGTDFNSINVVESSVGGGRGIRLEPASGTPWVGDTMTVKGLNPYFIVFPADPAKPITIHSVNYKVVGGGATAFGSVLVYTNPFVGNLGAIFWPGDPQTGTIAFAGQNVVDVNLPFSLLDGQVDSFEFTVEFTVGHPVNDFDGDGKSDIAVYETSTGNWFGLLSTDGFAEQLNFGGSNFLPVPGDYDGDGTSDTAVYDTTNGDWFIDQSTDGFRIHPSFGGPPGYIPVPGDYDGDGKTDIGVYQTSSGHWFYIGSTSGFGQHLSFGGMNFVPVPGDYDGDGTTDTAVYDMTNGNWFISQSTAGDTSHLGFGGGGYLPVPGDYDGDGKTDTGVYQTSTGHWFYVGSTSGFGQHLSFGGTNFTPVPEDYDGDGVTDTAVYDTTNGNWFIDQNTDGFKIQPAFGGAGYVPVLPQVTILRAMGLL